MKIIVGGYIIGYPMGGMTWHHLHYLLGLASLGHELCFLEDSTLMPPYDPISQRSGDPAYGIDYMQRTFRKYGLAIAYHYRYGAMWSGLSPEEFTEFLKSADLFIAVSGVTPIDDFELPKKSIIIDTDPVFTQLRLPRDPIFQRYYHRFSHVASFGTHIGTPACRLPTDGLDWIPTRQPISLEHWPQAPLPDHGAFTTLGRWSQSSERHLQFEGQSYASSKAEGFEMLLSLPGLLAESGTGLGPASASPLTGQSPVPLQKITLELRMGAMPPADAARFLAAGWTRGDENRPSLDPTTYQHYIQQSLGELTVAKQIYTGIPSGWFSDRSAAFLATGRPVVTQSTGFESWLPTGEGLFAFTTLDGAKAAIDNIASNIAYHGQAARRIAETYFDSKIVLGDLLDRVM